MIDKLIKKIKSLFNKEDEMPLTQAEIREREKLNAKYNHPDDNYIGDDFLTEEEMQEMSYKKKRRGNFRTGYYAFGFVLAIGMIGFGLYNIIADAKYDIRILVQDDNIITKEECDYINEYFSKFVPDKNGDGKILLDVDYVYMPPEYSEEQASEWSAGINGIEKSLTSYHVAIAFGREGFLDAVDDTRPLRLKDGVKYVKLSELDGFDISKGKALENYCVAVRDNVKKGDKYSPEAIKIFDNMVKK